jgi:pyroglutamyl-peptidase
MVFNPSLETVLRRVWAVDARAVRRKLENVLILRYTFRRLAVGKQGMILVTGFQSYAGRAANPSELVAMALDGTTIGGAKVHGRALAVDFSAMCQQIPQLLTDFNPRLIVSLGLWPGEPMIRIERVAANWSWFELPDNAGHRQNGRVVADGPDGYLSSLPADAMQSAIRAAGLPCRQSGSAGTYLCNATSYVTLHHCALQATDTMAGFIHLPYLPSQVAELLDQVAAESLLEMHQRADLASMHLDDMIAAIRIGLETAWSLATD